MTASRADVRRILAVGVLAGVVAFALVALLTWSPWRGTVVGAITLVLTTVAGVLSVAVAGESPESTDTDRDLGSGFPVVALAAVPVVAVVSWLVLSSATVPEYLAVFVPMTVVVSIPLGIGAAVGPATIANAVGRRLGTTAERRIRWVGDVVARIPILDLYRLGRIVGDSSAVTTIRVLAGVLVPLWILYAVSPVDVVPDVVPPFTYVDDVLLYPLAREVVYTGHDYEVGVRQASKKMVVTRLRRVVVGVVVVLAFVGGVLVLGAASLFHL